MRLFLDTANIDEIGRGAAMGVVDGVTTNPTLVAEEGVEYRERVLEICEVVEGPVSAEGVATPPRSWWRRGSGSRPGTPTWW